MQFRWIPGNKDVILYYRLNRALEEAEKYKTALQKAKSQSKVSRVYFGISLSVCSPPHPLTLCLPACLSVCLSFFSACLSVCFSLYCMYSLTVHL